VGGRTIGQRAGRGKALSAIDEVWHELVLHGIGGRTITEAKRRMSMAEALQWVEYIRKRGSLNTGNRVEAAVAVLATIVNHALGGKAEVTDFMPHWDAPEASIDDLAKLFGAKRKG
jgi:hypothetical protein